MKTWFKYQYGYVNIDDDYLYLTNSGVWADAYKLKEYSNSTSSYPKQFKTIIFLVVTCGFFGFFFLKSLEGGSIAIGSLLTIYLLYNTMKTDLGSQFKIRKSDITSIEIKDDLAIIVFMNSDTIKIHQLFLSPI